MASGEAIEDAERVNGIDSQPFWRRLSLKEMSSEQWESLCDGCGRCCLNKLEDENTGEIAWTKIRCRLLDETLCRCTDYENRSSRVSDCVRLTPSNVRTLNWLPPSCAYRRLADGHDLCWWHPLVSGDDETVHLAGISVRGKTESEQDMPISDWEEFVVGWPAQLPADC